MAEAAPLQASAVLSEPGVKQETTGLDGFDFSMASEMASKRPLAAFGDSDMDADAKRLKTETAIDDGEVSFEDGMDLLVQNALSNINDLMGQLDGGEEEADMSGVVPTTEPDAPAADTMDLDVGPAVAEALAAAATPTFLSDPNKYIRQSNLTTLGTLAMTLLLSLSQKPADETILKLQDPSSDHTKSLRQLQNSLEATKKLYSPNALLSNSELDIPGEDSQITFFLVNLAQIGSWLFLGVGLQPVREADAHMLSLFRDPQSTSSKRVSDLWAAIKTQLAIEDFQQKDSTKSTDAQLQQSLVEGMDQKLRDGLSELPLSEPAQELISTLTGRKEELTRHFQSETGLISARITYPSDSTLRAFSVCAGEQLAAVSHFGQKLGVSIPDPTPPAAIEEDILGSLQGPTTDTGEIDMSDLDSFFEKTTSGLVQSALAGFTDEEPVSQETPAPPSEPTPVRAPAPPAKPEPPAVPTNFITDYKELEALVAESTSNYVKTTLQGLSPAPYQPTVPTSTAENMAAQSSNYLSHLQQHHAQHPYYTSVAHPAPEPQPQHPVTGENLPPNQTFPSAILYDKARQAALSKTTAHTRREGLHSTRRPWSQEEEKALMAGLDMVKGPHWSQILTLFGQNGTISDILKDRTQVQLKDKARNLKLFFLKTNSEMPYYLQAVTGELKTRAPTQAARKEAEERARLNSEEDQAKLQGIMALAGGLQHPPQHRAPGSPAVVTPAQAAAHAAAAGHHHQHANNQATSNGATAAALQGRLGVQGTAHHTLQSVPQPPVRPQNQLPPQVPRPQPQQPTTQGIQQTTPQTPQAVQQPQQSMGQYGQQPTHHHLQHQRHRPSSASSPTPPRTTPSHQRHSSGTPVPNSVAHSAHGSPVHSAHVAAASRPQTPQQQQPLHHSNLKFPTPTPQPTPQPQPQPQMSFTPATPAPLPDPLQQLDSHPADQNDNSAEATLLQGLQAALAEATS